MENSHSITVFWSDRLKLPNRDRYAEFLNKMSKRIHQGHARYGAPDRSKLYLKRLEIEVKAYKRTGNMEHLINAANYCWLESICPQSPKFHMDNTVDSVTRGKV